MFLYLTWILWIFGLELYVYGFPSPWDNFQSGLKIHRNCYSNLLKSLNNVSKLCPRLVEKLNTFVKKMNFYQGFIRKRLGKDYRNDCGIISYFHQTNHFDLQFPNQSPCFPENPDFHSACLNSLSLCGGQICEGFRFLEYEI